jgi:uncharacterized membrane protein YedE/YeeE
MRDRVLGGAIGVVFGVTLCWSGMSSPAVIRQALLFERSYLFLMFASAVATAAIGLQLLRRYRRAEWTAERPQRRHVVGSLLFGLGWGLANVCPGPIATQVGQGIAWSLIPLAGAFAGVYLFLRRGTAATEPARDAAPSRGRAAMTTAESARA